MVKINLKRIRIEKGYSLRELAKRCFISKSQLSLIETEKSSPTLDHLYTLSVGLDVPMSSLYDSDRK